MAHELSSLSDLQPFHFLKLPQEICDIIYDILLTAEAIEVKGSCRDAPNPAQKLITIPMAGSGLLFTCKEINRLAYGFIRPRILKVSGRWPAISKLSEIPPSIMSNISKLMISGSALQTMSSDMLLALIDDKTAVKIIATFTADLIEQALFERLTGEPGTPDLSFSQEQQGRQEFLVVKLILLYLSSALRHRLYDLMLNATCMSSAILELRIGYYELQHLGLLDTDMVYALDLQIDLKQRRIMKSHHPTMMSRLAQDGPALRFDEVAFECLENETM